MASYANVLVGPWMKVQAHALWVLKVMEALRQRDRVQGNTLN